MRYIYSENFCKFNYYNFFIRNHSSKTKKNYISKCSARIFMLDNYKIIKYQR